MFDQQVARLLERGYPPAARLSVAEFAATISPLRPLAESLPAEPRDGSANASFVVVVRAEMVSPEAAMELTSLANGKPGFAALDPRTSGDFQPIAGLELPSGPYVATGIEAGTEYLNVTPEDALRGILARGRSPLTIEEGIAAVTQFPGLLRKNACFSLAGSRGPDQRVPAIWISDGRPRLGWCWDRNPHTWLGAASCSGRLGSE